MSTGFVELTKFKQHRPSSFWATFGTTTSTNIQTDIFLNHFFGALETLIQTFLLKTQHNCFLQSQYFLYCRLHSITEKVKRSAPWNGIELITSQNSSFTFLKIYLKKVASHNITYNYYLLSSIYKERFEHPVQHSYILHSNILSNQAYCCKACCNT